MSTGSVPVYYELSWSILSTIGICNVFFGILVAGIMSFSPIAYVPIVTSAAGAIANGLCYFAFYKENVSSGNQAIASAFADVMWLIQEAGLSFYSYVILGRILRNKQRVIFRSLFWTIIIIITVIRVMIAITRVKSILESNTGFQTLINNLHIGYFVMIAFLECLSAYFLLTTFGSAKKTSLKAAIQTGLIRYLMRSTEVRLAMLAIIGVLRAITYSFQTSAQSATNVASQVDRFAFTLECLFPVVMFIDILASKLIFTEQTYGSSTYSRGQQKRNQSRNFISRSQNGDLSSRRGENIIEVHATGKQNIIRSDSQERIIGDETLRRTPSDIDLTDMDPRRDGINRTVEFAVHDSSDSQGQ